MDTTVHKVVKNKFQKMLLHDYNKKLHYFSVYVMCPRKTALAWLKSQQQ
jgi:hypothetical protein